MLASFLDGMSTDHAKVELLNVQPYVANLSLHVSARTTEMPTPNSRKNNIMIALWFVDERLVKLDWCQIASLAGAKRVITVSDYEVITTRIRMYHGAIITLSRQENKIGEITKPSHRGSHTYEIYSMNMKWQMK